MLLKKQLLSQDNLNNAFLSKTNTGTQVMLGNLTVSGGQMALKNTIFTDNAGANYLRIDPQGNQVIIYDGVSNQQFNVYSSSGSEATYITTINQGGANPTFGQIDVSAAVNRLEFLTNTGKNAVFGGSIGINGAIPIVVNNGGKSFTIGGNAEATIQLGTHVTGNNNFHWVLNNDSGDSKRGLRLYNGTYGSGTHAMTVLQNGYVGLGSSQSPLARLDLGNDTGQKFYLYQNGGVRLGMGIDLSAGANRELALFSSTEGSQGHISFGMRTESNGAYSEKMRLWNSGNLSIGTTSNFFPLGVHKSGDNWHAGFGDFVSTSGGILRIGGNHFNGLGAVGSVIQAVKGSDGSPRDLYLQRDGGYVGVGTNNPLWKFHVSGDMGITQWIRVYGSQGLYFQDRGGGWHMEDSNWVRSYNGRGILTTGQIAVGAGAHSGGGQLNVGKDGLLPSNITWTNAQIEVRSNDGGAVGMTFHRAGYNHITLYMHGAGADSLQIEGSNIARGPVWHHGNQPRITVSASAPSSPAVNDIWIQI